MNWPWRSSEPEGLLLRLLWLPLAIPAWFFRLGAAADRGGYLRRGPGRRRVDARVISVGSLLVGGSGKTPMASWLAEQMHRRGHKVALLSRGYGGQPDQDVTIVSDGKVLHIGPKQAGDEPVLLAGQVAGVPVIVSRDRGLAALRAISCSGAEVLILDDGFQHHRLHRDLDLLTFDADFGLGNGKVLPRGPLREPLAGMQRADAIIDIGGPVSATVETEIQRFGTGVSRFRAHRRPVSLGNLRGDVRVQPSVLRGMKVGMLTGIARPDSLRTTLEALGAVVIAERIFPDHHRYVAKNLRGLADETEVWVTTEKDAGKIMPYWAGAADIRVLGVRLDVEDGDALLEWIEGELGLGRFR